MRRADQNLRDHCQAQDDEQKQAKTAQHAHSDERLVVVWGFEFRQRARPTEGPERIWRETTHVTTPIFSQTQICARTHKRTRRNSRLKHKEAINIRRHGAIYGLRRNMGSTLEQELLGDRIQGEHGQVLEQPNDGDHPEKVGNEPSACRSARLPATYGSGRIASLQGDAAGSLRKVARLSNTSAMKAPIG